MRLRKEVLTMEIFKKIAGLVLYVMAFIAALGIQNKWQNGVTSVWDFLITGVLFVAAWFFLPLKHVWRWTIAALVLFVAIGWLAGRSNTNG